MKMKTILVIASVVSLLVCVTILILGIIHDYGYDYEVAFRSIATSAGEVFEFFIVIFTSTFVGICLFLWAFIKTSVKKKVLTVLIVFIIGSSFYIKIYHFSDWYFDYIIQDNPYDGHLVRDLVKDVDNRLNMKKDSPDFYQDTIGNSHISITKYRATLFGNKSEVAHNYNVCIKGKSIKFVAVDGYFQDADYCKPNELDPFRPMSFTLEDLGNNSFICKECKNYFLPIYWKYLE